MIIALDYDLTYTADCALWDRFVTDAKSQGHRVICVTARRETKENVAECQIPGVVTYCTSGSPKRWYMNERGIAVDVWIDDQPEVVVHGR